MCGTQRKDRGWRVWLKHNESAALRLDTVLIVWLAGFIFLTPSHWPIVFPSALYIHSSRWGASSGDGENSLAGLAARLVGGPASLEPWLEPWSPTTQVSLCLLVALKAYQILVLNPASHVSSETRALLSHQLQQPDTQLGRADRRRAVGEAVAAVSAVRCVVDMVWILLVAFWVLPLFIDLIERATVAEGIRFEGLAGSAAQAALEGNQQVAWTSAAVLLVMLGLALSTAPWRWCGALAEGGRDALVAGAINSEGISPRWWVSKTARICMRCLLSTK